MVAAQSLLCFLLLYSWFLTDIWQRHANYFILIKAASLCPYLVLPHIIGPGLRMCCTWQLINSISCQRMIGPLTKPDTHRWASKQTSSTIISISLLLLQTLHQNDFWELSVLLSYFPGHKQNVEHQDEYWIHGNRTCVEVIEIRFFFF